LGEDSLGKALQQGGSRCRGDAVTFCMPQGSGQDGLMGIEAFFIDLYTFECLINIPVEWEMVR
jgi:hypothetical protein